MQSQHGSLLRGLGDGGGVGRGFFFSVIVAVVFALGLGTKKRSIPTRVVVAVVVADGVFGTGATIASVRLLLGAGLNLSSVATRLLLSAAAGWLSSVATALDFGLALALDVRASPTAAVFLAFALGLGCGRGSIVVVGTTKG